MNSRANINNLCFLRMVAISFCLLGPARLAAQSRDAISREVSIFNYNLPSANAEAISREVSIFNYALPSAKTEAVSREVSVFNYTLPTANTEAISREVSVFNYMLPTAKTEAFSREVSLFNLGVPSAKVEAISREVSIYNYGVPPVVFFIGSTNVLGGETNLVPFVLQTVLDLTNLNLMLKTDDSHLQVLAVTPLSSEVVSTVSGTIGSNAHPIAFTLNPAAQPPTSRILAWLNFQALTNGDSAIVPLIISGFTAIRASGQAVPNIVAGGRVIVIVTKPILLVTNRPQFGITMYAVPGTTNAIEATTNLAPAAWHELERLLVSDRQMILYGLATNARNSSSAPSRFGRDRHPRVKRAIPGIVTNSLQFGVLPPLAPDRVRVFTN